MHHVNVQVDVWALGICAIEMAELTPPRWSVHPLRVIFMISRDPPPKLTQKPEVWSPLFHDFLAQCLQKVRAQLRSVLLQAWCATCGEGQGPEISRSLQPQVTQQVEECCLLFGD